MSRTIAAIATPLMTGGLSVIRISGDNATTVADKIFISVSEKKLSSLKGYTATYGNIVNNGEIIDDCVALVFLAPHSYTGENTVEFSCHGGMHVTQTVLELALNNGAVIAQPGEFTKNAFLNGKLDLTQAEAVADLISASGEKALKAARSQAGGKLFKKCEEITENLVFLSSHLAAWADFPDEIEEEVEQANLSTSLMENVDKLKALRDSFSKVEKVKSGINVCIAGKPNAGKSTLMNKLCGKERSIVSDIAGTTRDVVDIHSEIDGINVRFFDTAGIRSTTDTIEEIGVRKSKEMMRDSDFVIAVFDGSQPISDEDIDIIDCCDDNFIAVINKTDLDSQIDSRIIEEKFGKTLYISADTEENMDRLKATLAEMFSSFEVDYNSALISNTRQYECVQSCIENLSTAIEGVENGLPYDVVTVVIEDGITNLLELTGKVASKEVVDQIFERFCVGK